MAWSINTIWSLSLIESCIGRNSNEEINGKAASIFSFWAISHFALFVFLSVTYGAGDVIVQVSVQETAGITRQDEPVTSELPLPVSLKINSADDLALQDSNGRFIPTQSTVPARWKGFASNTFKPV